MSDPNDWKLRSVTGGTGLEPQRVASLGEAIVTNDRGPHVPVQWMRPTVAESADGVTTCIFQNLEDELVKRIDRAEVVIGCMAWLTNERVLAALAKKEAVSLIVQKEDFLRPDSGRWTKKGLLELYKKIPGLSRSHGGVNYLSVCSSHTIPPVMCLGMCPESKSSAMPRMHHKFMVFCHFDMDPPIDGQDDARELSALSVWTGSFNATHNGVNSFENAVVIEDKRLATEYWREWQALIGLAEPLDWNSRWIAPDFRIGT